MQAPQSVSTFVDFEIPTVGTNDIISWPITDVCVFMRASQESTTDQAFVSNHASEHRWQDVKPSQFEFTGGGGDSRLRSTTRSAQPSILIEVHTRPDLSL